MAAKSGFSGESYGPPFRDPVHPQTTIDEVIENDYVINLQIWLLSMHYGFKLLFLI